MPEPLRACLRILRILGMTAGLIAPLLWRSWGRPVAERRLLARQYRRRWGQRLCRILGVRVSCDGEAPPDSGCLVIANHRSYLDPAVLLTQLDTTLLSKAEVARIPVIGFGAKAVGIVFVQREAEGSRIRALRRIGNVLGGGENVVVFAEGTTHAGAELLPFKPGTFELAARLGAPVVPVALEYDPPTDAWVHEGMARHFFRVYGRRRSHVRMRIGPRLTDTDAEALRRRAADWVQAAVTALRAEA